MDNQTLQQIKSSFWEKVDIRDNNSCWIWKRAVCSSGYGIIKIDKKTYLAHRISFELSNSKILDKWVCHRCDNRLCVNPNHLFLGNRSDNMKDAYNKGRIKNIFPHRKFGKTEISDIRKMSLEGYSNRKIAKLFNVYHSCINQIINNQSYKEM